MYVGDVCICNIYCEVEDKKRKAPDFNQDSLLPVFSSGKTVGSVLIAILVDQGLLDYNEPVAKYWPEFANNGKDKILLKDVLRHDARLPSLDKRLDLQWTLTENIKKNMIGKILEE